MRVIAGSARSLPLKAPAGLDTRPTTDRIKETLFNMLQQFVPGAVFVDLFAGSGAIGIEALSRGAAKAYFADNSPKAIQCISENLLFTKLQEHAIVIKQDAVSALSNIHEDHVDLIFMDPPYDAGLEELILTALRGRTYLTEETLIIVEASLRTDFSYLDQLGYEIVKDKQYKTNRHVFLRKKHEYGNGRLRGNGAAENEESNLSRKL